MIILILLILQLYKPQLKKKKFKAEIHGFFMYWQAVAIKKKIASTATYISSLSLYPNDSPLLVTS